MKLETEALISSEDNYHASPFLFLYLCSILWRFSKFEMMFDFNIKFARYICLRFIFFSKGFSRTFPNYIAESYRQHTFDAFLRWPCCMFHLYWTLIWHIPYEPHHDYWLQEICIFNFNLTQLRILKEYLWISTIDNRTVELRVLPSVKSLSLVWPLATKVRTLQVA